MRDNLTVKELKSILDECNESDEILLCIPPSKCDEQVFVLSGDVYKQGGDDFIIFDIGDSYIMEG